MIEKVQESCEEYFKDDLPISQLEFFEKRIFSKIITAVGF